MKSCQDVRPQFCRGRSCPQESSAHRTACSAGPLPWGPGPATSPCLGFPCPHHPAPHENLPALRILFPPAAWPGSRCCSASNPSWSLQTWICQPLLQEPQCPAWAAPGSSLTPPAPWLLRAGFPLGKWWSQPCTVAVGANRTAILTRVEMAFICLFFLPLVSTNAWSMGGAQELTNG